MENLVMFTGRIQLIQPIDEECCSQMVTMQNAEGVFDFIISSETYVIDMVRLRLGMQVSVFYDANLPVPLIYPPQYQAVIIGRNLPNEKIYVGYFDKNLIAMNEQLKLTISRGTEIISSNGQPYLCPVGENILIVYYTITTRSIPPQTTPRKIIVMC
ncbi:hypothetical protein [Faecalimonas sp.]